MERRAGAGGSRMRAAGNTFEGRATVMGGADMSRGTFVGLDVHAKSVVAGLIDAQTGQITRRRATHRTAELVDWLGRLPVPVQVAYEAEPTGVVLAHALDQAGIGC